MRQRLRQQLQDPDPKVFYRGYGPTPDHDTRLRNPRVPVFLWEGTHAAGRSRRDRNALFVTVSNRRVDAEVAQRQREQDSHNCWCFRSGRLDLTERGNAVNRRSQPVRIHGKSVRRGRKARTSSITATVLLLDHRLLYN